MRKTKQVLALLLALFCGILGAACTTEPEDTREDVLVVLLAKDGTRFVFSAEENKKEITIPADVNRAWDFDVKVVFPPYENGKEVDFVGTEHSFGVSYNFRNPEGKYETVTSVHEIGDYELRVEIPKDHKLCKPYEIEFIIHVV